ncbi:MAG: hypothetical protein LBD64_05050, partial [Odoribacteraceae bacterium]|nr:hypothetical protein [Odoribacteraceae bacterium]
YSLPFTVNDCKYIVSLLCAQVKSGFFLRVIEKKTSAGGKKSSRRAILIVSSLSASAFHETPFHDVLLSPVV